MKRGGFKKYFAIPERYKKLIFILFPLIPLAVSFLLVYHPPVDFVSESLLKDGKAGYSVYDDKPNGGSSDAEKIELEKDKVAFSYTLKEGYAYPYSGISFFSKEGKFFNLSEYDFVKIKISAVNGRRLPFVLHTHIDGYTSEDDFNTLKNNQYILNVTTEPQEIMIPLADLVTPEWWYSLNQKLENQVASTDFSKVKAVNITNCAMLDKGALDEVRIEKISFHTDLFPFYMFSAIWLPVYFLTGFIFFRKKREEKVEVNFVYEKTETVSQLQKEEEAVFRFLTSSYHRPDLSIVEVQNETGIYEQKISSIIRNKTGMNYKQFLNKLRISEAKRLLKETDLQVSEVAFKVGYGNVSHFNRVFKDLEGCSPNEFRKGEPVHTRN